MRLSPFILLDPCLNPPYIELAIASEIKPISSISHLHPFTYGTVSQEHNWLEGSLVDTVFISMLQIG